MLCIYLLVEASVMLLSSDKVLCTKSVVCMGQSAKCQIPRKMLIISINSTPAYIMSIHQYLLRTQRRHHEYDHRIGILINIDKAFSSCI